VKNQNDYLSPPMLAMLAVIKQHPRGYVVDSHRTQQTAEALERRGLVRAVAVGEPPCRQRVAPVTYLWVADPAVKKRPARVTPYRAVYPKVIIHGQWTGEYLGVDEAAKARGCKFYHRVRIANLVSNAGSDNQTPERAGMQIVMCCDEEVGQ
jgi:hypothetical protein